MKKCFIFGGLGFIGSRLIKELKNTEREVTVVDVSLKKPESLPVDFTYFPLEHDDVEYLSRLVNGANEVINLAYTTVPKTSFENPIGDINGNLPFAVHLFQACTKAGVEKVIQLSSGGAVYGRVETLPISENTYCRPISPYGITKLAIEHYALMFNSLDNLPVVILRPGNAYGEGQRPYTGQGLVATLMASILDRKTISLFGSETITRDYIHVDDLAAAIVSSLDLGIIGQVYNVGTGIGQSNKDVLDGVSSLAKNDGYHIPEVEELQPRPFDVSGNILDITKIKEELKWEPKIIFETGIAKTWEWFKKQQQPSFYAGA